MQRSLDYASKTCPTYNVSSTVASFYNSTEFVDRDRQLAEFACRYADSVRLMTTITYWNGMTYVFGFVFGIPSALLALTTFCRKEFSTVSFFYHRAINIIELFYMGFIFESALQWMTDDLKLRSRAWTRFLTYFHYKLDLALPLSIQLIVVWVAVERVALCFSGRWFQKINRKSIANVVVVVSLIVSISFYFPLAFTTEFVFDNTTGTYYRKRSGFGTTSGYDTYVRFSAFLAFVQFAAMTAATIATIAGLIRMSRRKRKLAASAGSKSINGQQLLQQAGVNSQLCLLQLCESIPVLVNCLILICIQTFSYTMNVEQLVSMTYEDAVENIFLFRRFQYLSILQTIVDLIEHSTHFYRYYLFSKKVRDTVSRLIKKNAVSQVSIVVN